VNARQQDVYAEEAGANATKFVHEGAGAGVHRYYRVEPCRGTRRGEPSNVATV
jgi:hypothetical protein